VENKLGLVRRKLHSSLRYYRGKKFKVQILHLKIGIPLKRVFLVRRTFLTSPGSGGIRD
jgi:hypothetical protein